MTKLIVTPIKDAPKDQRGMRIEFKKKENSAEIQPKKENSAEIQPKKVEENTGFLKRLFKK